MFESKERRFFWGIYVATEAHGEILEIILSLDSAVHDYTNPVIEWSSMWFLNLFQLLSNERCNHKECLFKVCIQCKGWFMEFYFIFFLFYPISVNNIFHDMISLINTDLIFTLNNVNVEEL